jgi:hypothetical protein
MPDIEGRRVTTDRDGQFRQPGQVAPPPQSNAVTQQAQPPLNTTASRPHRNNNPKPAAKSMGSFRRFIGYVAFVIVAVVFLTHWYTSTDIGHMSVSGLESMSCSKFNSLSQGDQQTVATRIENSQYGTPTDTMAELGDGEALASIQNSCQNNPSGTVGSN